MLKIFSQYFSLHVLQRIGLDFLLLVVAVIVSAVFIESGQEGVELKGLLPSALGFSMVMIVVNFAFGLYRPVDEDSARTALARFVLSALFCLPAAYATMLFLPWQGFGFLSMRLQLLVLVLIVLLLRVLINRSQASSIFAPRILVIGTGEEALEVSRVLQAPEQGRVEVLGFFAAGNEETKVDGEKVVSGANLYDTVKRLTIDMVIVAIRELRGRALPLRELLDCKLSGVRVLDLPTFHERIRHQVKLDSLRSSWLIFGEGFQQPLLQVLSKRIFDLIGAALLIVVTLPFLLLAGFLIVSGDHGPVFYFQERVGLGGQVFRRIKFRCMPVGESVRMTRIGQVLHRLHLDRLPQLLNVLRGDMSLVGPRPERPSHVDQQAREFPFYGLRHCVKPGLTGWARVRYRNGESTDAATQKLQYDLYYVKNHNLVLDMLVLLETVHVVLMGRHAR